MKNLKQILITSLLLLTATINAQVKIGDNVTTVDPNAVFEIESTSKGMLLPRMTATERDAISNPTNSMLIYNTTESCINIYNAVETKWKSICGENADGSAQFNVDCTTLVVSGTYQTGVALDAEDNFITVTVDVTELGSYAVVADAAGMYFSAAGTFTTLGQQDLVLAGQGYPLVTGLNFLALDINGSLCTTVINVSSGLANVTGCGTQGALTGDIYANVAIEAGTIYKSYTAGPAYTGGGVYGVTSATVNGIRISSPVNGTFTASGAPVDYIIAGTATQPGNTTLAYSVNGFACSFIVPVQSGTGRASAVACTGTLSGTYAVGGAMTGSNTKVVTLTVSTAGTFYIRTNTVNGIYFAGSATAGAAGALNVTLTAVGTPIANTTDTYTVTVSSSATAFVTCTFTVTTTLPTTIPAFNTLSCAALSAGVSYIKANNTGAADHFGSYLDSDITDSYFGKSTKISADGLTLAVGALNEDGDLTGGQINSTNNNNLGNSGAVYIYTRTSKSANWAFQAKIKASNAGSSDFFGTSVDLSNDGNTLVVGANKEDGSGTGVNPVSNNSAVDAGAAYVFVRSGSTWSQQAYLKGNQSTASDFFGSNVAVSGDGNTVAVGAVSEDGSGTGINPIVNNSKLGSGAVFTFTRSGATWTSEAYIKAAATDVDDRFGNDVALNNDGTTLVVGAYMEDGSSIGVNPTANNSASNSGAMYVFQKTSGTWAQQAYIKAGQVTAGDSFGISVAIDGSGNRIVMGSRSEDGNGTGVNPAANESAADSGAAYVYSRSGSTWTQEAYLKASNTGANDGFGTKVSISNNGEHVLAGAFREDGTNTCVGTTQNNTGNDRGAVYMFSLVSGSWVSAFTFKQPAAAGTTDNDFMCANSVDSDGKTVVCAAYLEDGSGSGVNPATNNSATNAGCVYVFTKP
ncbi:beta strand repeat-containing protein [Flavobacterium sp.]|jgi:hypothetical protein|uniref:beta strand repeat-containing protein n=1 Tax=Flavobacterium sp. TaxID=239 RepID=UPI0037BF2D85